jgi:hypothetical protein
MELKDYKTLRVKKALVGNVPLEDPFFDTLKEDYIGFKDWFKRKENDYCYVSYSSNPIKVEAFLYLKIEDIDEQYNDVLPPFNPAKRLKIGTFKVTRNGARLGERFLKIIFDNAVLNRVDEIYVTIFDKTEEQKALISLLIKWGFEFWGNKKDELVLFRQIRLVENDLFRSYPLFKIRSVFLTPVFPSYHTDLFPDSILNNESPLKFSEDSPHRNGISKVFLSRSIFKGIRQGDIVVIYRTGGKHLSVVTTICVVEKEPEFPKSISDLSNIIGNRSVFNTPKDLEDFWNEKEIKPFVVSLLSVISLPKRPNLETLIQHGVIKDIESAPRGFEKITTLQFKTILRLSNADESYFID